MVNAEEAREITYKNRDDDYIEDIIKYIENEIVNVAKKGYDYLYIDFCGYYLSLLNDFFKREDTICIDQRKYKNFFRDRGEERVISYFKQRGFEIDRTGDMYDCYGLKISWGFKNEKK